MNPDFEQFAVLGSFTPLRLHMRLEGTSEEYEAAAPMAMATVVHEHMHWFQTLFSGYGQIAWDAHRQMTSYLISQWRELSSAVGGKWRLPIAHLALSDSRVLAPAVIAHRATLELLRLGQARYALPDPGVTLDALGIRLVPPFPANPTVLLGGNPHVLQVMEVLEGHAAYVEATYLEREVGLTWPDALDRESRPKRYLVAFDYFVGSCGFERRGDFPFLCDLALQTRWEPVVPETEADWQASHPAYRFVALVDVLRQHPEMTVGDGSNLPATYESFASDLLSATGFAPIQQVIADRIAAHARKTKLLELEKLMVSGLEFRLEHPWCAGNPAIDSNLLAGLLRRFRVPLVQIEGGFGSFGDVPQNLVSEVMMELQYQALAAQVLGDISPIAQREGSLECAFSKYRIEAGCEYQRSIGCTGRYRPGGGPPVQPVVGANGDVTGCSFETLLNVAGLSSNSIDFDPNARMPDDQTLKSVEQRLREGEQAGSDFEPGGGHSSSVSKAGEA